MKFSMTGQSKGDLPIQVTAWAGLTVCRCTICNYKERGRCGIDRMDQGEVYNIM